MDPINSWQIERGKYKLWQILFSWAPESLQTVTAAIKFKDALPWKESYDKHRQYIKTWKHHFADKVHIVKAVASAVEMYRCESWTIQKAEHWRADAFKLWFGIRPLRVPCTTKRSINSICKEINPEYSLKGLMLKLKLQCVGHLMQRANSLEKTLMLRKIKSRRMRRNDKRWDG